MGRTEQDRLAARARGDAAMRIIIRRRGLIVDGLCFKGNDLVEIVLHKR